MIIKISKDFSETPGARYYTEGPYSGQEFREEHLIPKFLNIKDTEDTLTIDFDGGYGYPTSFLEEAFGGLARKFSPKTVLSKLEFISYDEPSLIDEVKDYIKAAKYEG